MRIKVFLKLNKHTISTLTQRELKIVKGGTQLASVQDSKRCNPLPPPPSDIKPGIHITENGN